MDEKQIVEKMTLKEKVDALMLQDGRFGQVKRLAVRGMQPADNPRGTDDYSVEDRVRTDGKYRPVAYPQEAAVAASWDNKISYEIGAEMGRECRQQDIQILFRPGVNIKRSPLCGRNFEYYSEDPVLSGEMGAAFIQGVQEQGTAACLKHYAVNSQEFERMTTNAVVSDRALHEIYLKPFEIAVKKANPWTLMTSYNKVNGKWVPENEELMEILKEEYGYQNIVISDAMAVHTEKIRSHQYGLDFELDVPGSHNLELKDAVEQGKIQEHILDQSLEKMYQLQNRLEEKKDFAGRNSFEQQHDKARRFAAEGIVLLKNEGILPLKGKQKIALIGKLFKMPNYMGCGSGRMNGWRVDSTYDEICKLAQPGTEIFYAEGYRLYLDPEVEDKLTDSYLLNEALEAVEKADVVVVAVGLPEGYESEGFDRQSLKLPAQMTAMFRKVCEKSKQLVVVNVSGAPVDLRLFHEKADAVLHSYLAGESMGGAIADVLWGMAEPGGRLPETFPMRMEDIPCYMNFPQYPNRMKNVYYGEDVFVGYRWYQKRNMPVLYPFGHGLSYTTYEYGTIHKNKDIYYEGEDITVSLSVKNNGERKGVQVLQLYIEKPQNLFVNPIRELKMYEKVHLNPEEQTTITFSLKCSELMSYDEEQKKWVLEPGIYKISIGLNCEEMIDSTEVCIRSEKEPFCYHSMLGIEWFQRNENIQNILKGRTNIANQIFGDREKTKCSFTQALPIYRYTEKLIIGNDQISKKELSDILDDLNKKTVEETFTETK